MQHGRPIGWRRVPQSDGGTSPNCCRASVRPPRKSSKTARRLRRSARPAPANLVPARPAPANTRRRTTSTSLLWRPPPPARACCQRPGSRRPSPPSRPLLSATLARRSPRPQVFRRAAAIAAKRPGRAARHAGRGSSRPAAACIGRQWGIGVPDSVLLWRHSSASRIVPAVMAFLWRGRVAGLPVY